MTLELGDDAPNVIAYLLAWLLPLAATIAGSDPPTSHLGAKRWAAGDPLPYFMVNRIEGADNEYEYADQPLVSIHIFSPDYTTTARLADRLHKRMRVLIKDPSTDVMLPDSSTVNAEWVQTVEKPTRRDYGDPQIERFVGRYRLSLHFV